MGWGGYWDRNETIITERMSESGWSASPRRTTYPTQQIRLNSAKVEKFSNSNERKMSNAQKTQNQNKRISHVLICAQCGKVYGYSSEKEKSNQNQICPHCAYEERIRNKEGVA